MLLNDKDATRRTWNCQLAAGGDTSTTAPTSRQPARTVRRPPPLALRVTHEFTAAGTATLSCAWSGTAGAASGPTIDAIRVGNITTS